MMVSVHWTVMIEGPAPLSDGEACSGEGTVELTPGTTGVTCWRFEFAPADAADGRIAGRSLISRESRGRVGYLSGGDLLLQVDSVRSPAGCASCIFINSRHSCLSRGVHPDRPHGGSTTSPRPRLV